MVLTKIDEHTKAQVSATDEGRLPAVSSRIHPQLPL